MKEIGEIRANQVMQAIDKGFLLYVDDKKQKVKMSAIYLWAINALKVELREDGKTEIVYDDRRIVSNENGIETGLKLIKVMYKNEKCPTEHIEYFYEVLVSIIYRYQRIYSMKKGLKQLWKNKRYNLWTSFLEIVMEMFREYGAVDNAKRIREKIYNVYRRKEKILNINEEQSSYIKWEKFFVNLNWNNYKKTDLLEVAKGLIRCKEYKKLYPIIEAFIYTEIYNHAMMFIDSLKKSVNSKIMIMELFEYYFEKTAEINDIHIMKGIANLNNDNEMQTYKKNIDILCMNVFYYLKALYVDLCFVNDARLVSASIEKEVYETPNDELRFKLQLYFLFFELIIDWNFEYNHPEYLCQKYENVVLDTVYKLQTKSFSANSTSTAFIVLFLARALVPSGMVNKEIDEYIEQMKANSEELFQMIMDVFKYQYQMNDKEQKKLSEAVNVALSQIGEVLQSYAIKKNE